jgi:sortase A
MILRVSMVMLLFSVALAAVVPVVVSLSGAGEEQSASQVASVEPVENEATAQQEDDLNPGEHPQTAKTHGKQRTHRKPPPLASPPAPPPPEPPPPPAPEAPKTLPVAPQNWPQPSGKEVAATQAPRYYTPPRDSALSLTVSAIGLYDVPVINSTDPAALDRGVVHFTQTPMPWDQRPQKNVYLAGHRLGWPGTGSRLIFYNLNKLQKGNWVVLKDGAGDTYDYQVSEVFVVTPDADWAMQPVRGRDMLTLQTCTFPDLKNRLIVRADRV